MKVDGKILEVDVVRIRCGYSGHKTLKLVVSQEVNNEIKQFLVCLYKFRKGKSYFNTFWVVVVKNGRCFLTHETLKSAISQE